MSEGLNSFLFVSFLLSRPLLTPPSPSLKKTNRVIIRNLSFYAKESHVRSTLGSFGEIVEFTLPTVSGDSVGAKRKQQVRKSNN